MGRGKGFLKAKTVKGNCEAKLEFPEGWGGGEGFNPSMHMGEECMFCGTTQYRLPGYDLSDYIILNFYNKIINLF